jgi:hypothetical protein
MVTVRNEQQELIGIMPMYEHNTKLAKFIPCRQLLFIGSSPRISNTVRSEYLNFICHKKREKDINLAVFKYLAEDPNWDRLVLSDVKVDSELFALVTSSDNMNSEWYSRSILKDSGIRIHRSKGLDQYKQHLSPSNRREIFNRRTRLSVAKIEHTKKVQAFCDEFFAKLNELHWLRWKKPCFDDQALEFHRTLIEFEDAPFTANFGLIDIENDVSSIVYNIDYNQTRFNLQLGFAQPKDKKLSLGLLQLGFSIEDFFLNTKLNFFDLLAGQGKHSFYKEKFNGEAYRLFSIEIIRHPLLQRIYKLYDYVKNKR